METRISINNKAAVLFKERKFVVEESVFDFTEYSKEGDYFPPTPEKLVPFYREYGLEPDDEFKAYSWFITNSCQGRTLSDLARSIYKEYLHMAALNFVAFTDHVYRKKTFSVDGLTVSADEALHMTNEMIKEVDA